MPYIGNVLTSFAVETGNIVDQAVTAPKLSATGGTNGQVLALDAGGNLVWTSDPAGQWVTSGSNIYFDSGNVGIGTNTLLSGAKLTVAGASLAVTGQNLDHSANSIRIGEEGSGAAQIRCYGPDASTNGSLTLRMSRSDGSNSQDVVIDSSGRVGINNSSPGTLLSIGSSATGGYGGGVYLNRGSSSYNFYEASDGTNSVIFGLDNNVPNVKIGTINSFPVGFYVGNGECARFDTSRRFLVGTVGAPAGGNGNDSLLQVQEPASGADAYSGILLTGAGYEHATIAQHAYDLYFTANAYPANTGSNQSIIFQSGTSGGGGPNEIARFISGTGLTFNGDTAAANALDDYEEGTYSANFVALGGNAGNYPGVQVAPNSSSYKGRYVKIGSYVFVELYVRFNLNNLYAGFTWTNSAILLPFTPGNGNSQQYTAATVSYLSGFATNIPSGTTVQGYVNSGAPLVQLSYLDPNSQETSLSKSFIQNNASAGIMLSCFYNTNSV